MRLLGNTVTVLSMMLPLQGMSALAQNMSYGADNFYRSDVVKVTPITFQDQYRTTIQGNLFTRNNLTHGISSPAIVVGHPMSAVKEQSANLYATKLAEQGFVTVSLDLPFWGASGGEPRNGVSPDIYAEAYSAAVDYLGTQDFVDRERIGALGVCGSGGFVVSAAKIDPRLKAIATASMYDMGAVNRDGLRKSQSLEERQAIIAAAAEQRWVEANGGEIQYSGGVPSQITANTSVVDREFYDYYFTPRGEFIPEGTRRELETQRTTTSNPKFMNFYPLNDIDSISPRPLLFIAGDQAHSREFSEYAYANAKEPKELVWVAGAGHVDLYDRVGLIPFDKLTQFFRVNLR
ncbi:alpha/beta superfamily hydrolase [Penicillium brevicompactum]|uniref:alpha/beta superfamily hydrolase n=1 Tax=Penicillium brevicompactum TaxID=5074 RepID=UPI002540D94B|nr:alpha/beta superfamily hydrolase [Penicillium brevicompactum]KAJ5337136.1 alpha/beta superfamily hydrolase [Penicillium brevicompactum]